MYLAIFKNISAETPLSNLITSLTDGLRSDIPYPDNQQYSYARLTAVVVKGNNVSLLDNPYSGGMDTTGLVLELENGLTQILEPDYDSGVPNGAGIVAVLEPEA